MADAAAPKKRGRPAKSAESKEAKEVHFILLPPLSLPFSYWNLDPTLFVLFTNQEKKAEKRAAAVAVDGESPAKRGRGRPKGSGKKAGGATATASKSKVHFCFIRTSRCGFHSLSLF